MWGGLRKYDIQSVCWKLCCTIHLFRTYSQSCNDDSMKTGMCMLSVLFSLSQVVYASLVNKIKGTVLGEHQSTCETITSWHSPAVVDVVEGECYMQRNPCSALVWTVSAVAMFLSCLWDFLMKGASFSHIFVNCRESLFILNSKTQQLSLVFCNWTCWVTIAKTVNEVCITYSLSVCSVNGFVCSMHSMAIFCSCVYWPWMHKKSGTYTCTTFTEHTQSVCCNVVFTEQECVQYYGCICNILQCRYCAL